MGEQCASGRRCLLASTALDAKISRYFTWTVGVQVAVLLAVVAALTGR